MTTPNDARSSIRETTATYPEYTGPIFDGDTHLYETEDAWSRYLPKKFAADWKRIGNSNRLCSAVQFV